MTTKRKYFARYPEKKREIELILWRQKETNLQDIQKKEKLNQIFDDKKKLIFKIPKTEEMETTLWRQQETILQDTQKQK